MNFKELVEFFRWMADELWLDELSQMRASDDGMPE